MKKFTKIIALLLTLLLSIGLVSACSNQKDDEISQDSNNDSESDQSTENSDTENKNLKGNLTMVGSTSMEKLANAASEAFMIKYPSVMVNAEFIGSSAGVEAVLAGTTDIGNASRNLKESEISSGAVENIVAIDGIAVIIDKSNSVTNLSTDQLKQIYTGSVNNWSQIGGPDLPIVVIGRESGSGTRSAFEEILEIEDQAEYSNEINSTGGVMAKVASTPGAIGYVSLDIINDTVVPVQINEVEPTEENIKAGSYSLSRPFVMATKGEISEQNDVVQAFFEYLSSEEGKELVKAVGLVPVD
ncbi:MAG TPA: phosphate ABC transporter substrate-binding protein [Clostridiales bacterium]|jgi:phosphate transport system substrate-binding protein|nr:phosphate ABC transporter substrate-binding protein [Clostridiales bacterium]